jgi:hypothetical protein
VLWMCLMVGFNNFRTGRGTTAALTEQLEAAMSDFAEWRLVARFGSTGNLAVESPAGCEASDVAAILGGASGRPWAVAAWPSLTGALLSLETLPRPDDEPGMRWTPGLSFAVGAPVDLAVVKNTERAQFAVLGPTVMGVFKYDVENERGRLDPTRRKGGWGAVSTDIARQAGGLWTSRASSALKGLARRAAK